MLPPNYCPSRARELRKNNPKAFHYWIGCRPPMPSWPLMCQSTSSKTQAPIRTSRLGTFSGVVSTVSQATMTTERYSRSSLLLSILYLYDFEKKSNHKSNYPCHQKAVGLEKACSWDQPPSNIAQKDWDKLATLYDSPSDIDLFTGGLAEELVKGSWVPSRPCRLNLGLFVMP